MDPFDKHPATTGLADRERHFADLAAEVADNRAVTEAAFDPAAATWEGIAAAELRAAPDPVRERAFDVAARLAWAATVTAVWASHVAAFNAKVDGLLTLRAQVPVQVERDLASSSWSALPLIELDLIRERRRSELISQLHRHWGEAYEEYIESGSRDVAGMFQRGPTWENLQAARRLGALAGDSPMVRFFAVRWDAAAAPAEALRLARLLGDPDHAMTGEEIALLHQLLGRFTGDEVFWFDFLTRLGPQGLLTLSGAIGLHLPDRGFGNGPPDPALARLIGEIQSRLGAGLALATTRSVHSTGHGAAGPGDYELPPDWLAELVAAGRSTYEITTRFASRPVELYGYQLLGPLLHAGMYDDQFLRLVGGDLVDFEIRQGGARLWDTWLQRAGPSGTGLRLDWTGGWDAARPTGFDPVAGLVSAMERNPEGALDMLTGRTQAGAGSWSDGSPKPLAPPPGGHQLPRLDYLLTDREWPSGWASPHQTHQYLDSHPGSTYATPALAEFGQALANAARLDDPRAITLVELIVYETNTDEQAMGYANDIVPGEPWHQTASNVENNLIDPVLRAPLATAISDYIIDVNASVLDSGAAMPGGLDAQFDTTHMVRFLADLGKDRAAHDTVLGAQAAYAAAGYHFYLSGEAGLLPDGPRERLIAAEGVATSYGAVSGALDVGAATADWYAQWQEDTARNTRVADSLTIAEIAVGSAADLVSTRAPGVGYAAGELTKEVLADLQEELATDHSGRSVYRNAELFGDSRQVAVDLAEAALYRSGQLDGLEEANLLDADGRPKPMAEWGDEDQRAWQSYKEHAGRAMVGELLEQAGSAYQVGLDRAERIMLGAGRYGLTR